MTAADDSTGGPPSDPQLKRIEAALANLGAEHQPPVGWQARVLAAVAEPAPRRRPWWHFAMPAMLAVATVLIVIGVIWPRAPQDLHEELASVVKHKGGTRSSGDEASQGDTLHLTWKSNRKYRDVWVYRTNTRLYRCTESTVCKIGPDSIQLDLTFEDLGEYEILAVSSDEPISPSSTGFVSDQALLTGPNATAQTRTFTIR